MAVTYAWRLDSDKYAYIVPPATLHNSSDGDKNYGFLSNTPLTDYLLNSVAQNAQDLFGEGSTSNDPLAEYEKAFAAMEYKINLAQQNKYQQGLSGGSLTNFDWSKVKSFDLLSAARYYNLDSENCADLRGVGIKGVRYLGSIEGVSYVEGDGIEETQGVPLTELNYRTSGSTATQYYMASDGTTGTTGVTVQPGIPGFTDVYGIYLSDQVEDDVDVSNDNVTTVPEFMFVVRNGQNGPRGAEGATAYFDESGMTQTLVTKDELKALEERVKKLEAALKDYQTNFTTITDAYYNMASAYSVVTGSIDTNKIAIEELTTKVSNIASGDGGGSDGVAGGGFGTSIDIWPITPSITSATTNIDGLNAAAYINSAYTFHLLGYVEGDGYGGEQSITVDKLYSLPSIKVGYNGITLDVSNLTVNGGIYAKNTITSNSGVTAPNISASTQVIASTVYAKNTAYAGSGFYQTTTSANTISSTTEYKTTGFLKETTN